MELFSKILVVSFWVLFCQNIFAQSDLKDLGRNGLLGETIPNSIVISAGGNYYFGDIERTSLFAKDFDNHVNWYGQIGYRRTMFTEHLKIKAAALVGELKGDKEGYAFKTTIIEPDLILEYYPIAKKAHRCDCSKKIVGLYLYGGAGIAFSKIALDVEKDNETLHTTTITPLCAFGAGYRQSISANLQLGFEFGYRFVIGGDAVKFNLDGYPIVPGNIKSSKWQDGFYTLGITAAYNF
ncbi:MAG: hypothetical protein LBS01_07380 [Prevotellaceae bacterium]|jgi:hypothetical protein|nr:hypothetical protein [Prevotellaceae bacterium]